MLLLCAAGVTALAVGSLLDPHLPPVAVDLVGRSGATVERLRTQLAVTRYQWWRGLQGRTRLQAGTGMLFDFREPSHVCLWMLHTPVPLQALFFDGARRLVGSAVMTPQSLQTHCPRPLVRYAIEISPGVVDASEISRFAFGNY